jgi:hypothetical protein
MGNDMGIVKGNRKSESISYTPALLEELEPRLLLDGHTQTLADLPVAARSAISTDIGRDQAQYHATAGADGLSLANTANGFTAQLQSGALIVDSGADSWRMSLEGFGYGGTIAPVGSAGVNSADNRVDCNYGAIDEWFVNGPGGLEQGFTVPNLSQAGTAGKGASLTLELTLGGDLVASANAAGNALTLKRPDGSMALCYTGLTATDATGRALPASMEVRPDGSGQELLIHVNTAGAQGAITIDPMFQTAELTASDGTMADDFGWSIAISGNTVVVGAEDATVNGNNDQGAVYVFVKPGSGWSNVTQTAKLTATGTLGDRFGSSVSISGNTVVVIAEGNIEFGGNDKSTAYVFVEPGSGWSNMTQTAKLTASDSGPNDSFGSSVAIDGNTVVVGDMDATVGENLQQGAAYVFVEPGSGWSDMTQTAKLTASDGTTYNWFGNQVAISGNTVVVGAYGATVGGNVWQGSAYVFVKPGSGWSNITQTAKLTATDVHQGDQFGAEDAMVNGNNDQGAAYVFVEPGSGWSDMTQTVKLTASDGASENYFGKSVAVSDNTVVVGAYMATVNGNNAQGAAYVFTESDSVWTQTAELNASDGAGTDEFGYSVAIDGNTVVVSTSDGEDNFYENSGVTYVFVVPGPGLSSPTIGAVSPNTGPLTGGTQVTITGTNLTGATAVKFGTASATIVSDTATQIVATSPAELAGIVDVKVTTAGGTSAVSSADQFTYAANPQPTVTSISPTSGSTAGGTTIIITGTNLTGATAVQFGNVAASSFTVNSATQITATSPAESAGTVDVKVTTPGGTSATSSADQFTYAANNAPKVTGISPTSGLVAGGTTVIITGTNLTGTTAVKFGTVAASSFTVNSATQITATSPAEAAGLVDVKVTTAGGTSATSTADQFTYAANNAPTVTGISPTSGLIAGGTTVIITGTNLTGATAVKFGSVAASSFTVNSATQITATSPAETAGLVDVKVTTAGGTSAASSADHFTYVAPANSSPVVTASAGSLSYTTNTGGVPVDSGITVSDADNTTLANATVKISAGYASGQDVLGFVPQNGITGIWNPATGTLTLSGNSSVANYQAALRSVTYQNASASPSTLARTVSFVANDGTSSSAPATRTITVSAGPQFRKVILVVPGILGSWNTNSADTTSWLRFGALGGNGENPEDFQLDPFDNTYANLMATLQQAQDAGQAEVFGAPYDWRESIDGPTSIDQVNITNPDTGVEYLTYWINKAAQWWDAQYPGYEADFKVDIIAHSMGGLVARDLIESSWFTQLDTRADLAIKSSDCVDQLVMLDTPNHGAVDAYQWLTWMDQVPGLAGALASDGVPFSGLISDLAKYAATAVGVPPAIVDGIVTGLNIVLDPVGGVTELAVSSYVDKWAAGLEDMLPDWNCDKTLISPGNPFLDGLNSDSGLSALASRANVWNFAGYKSTASTPYQTQTVSNLVWDAFDIPLTSLALPAVAGFGTGEVLSPLGNPTKNPSSQDAADINEYGAYLDYAGIHNGAAGLAGVKNVTKGLFTNVSHQLFPDSMDVMTATLDALGITGVSPIRPVKTYEGLFGPVEKFCDWAAKAASGALHSLEDAVATGWDNLKEWVCFWDPAQVLVTDSAGRRLGSDGSTSYAEIPGAIYLGDGSNGMVVLPWTFDAGQLSGVQITATGSGQEFQGCLASSDSGQVSGQSLGGGVLNQGEVEDSVSVRVGVGAAKAVMYQDADGSLAKVTMTNGSAVLEFNGSNLSQTFAKGVVTVTGSDMILNGVNLDNSNAKSRMAFSVSGGDGFVSVGSISGSSALGSLAAPTVDLTGQGISMTGSAWIITAQLHDLLNGAGIALPGSGAKAGTTITCNVIGDGSTISLGSPVKTLTAVAWQTGALIAPWVGTINITGSMKQSLAGNFGPNVTLSGVNVPARKSTLGSATIAGALNSTNWNITGNVGTITVKGNTADWALGSQTTSVGAVTSIILGTVDAANLYVSNKIATLKSIDWGSGIVNAGSIGTFGVTGKAAVPAHSGIAALPAISGDFGANLNLTQNGLMSGKTLGSATIAGNLTSPLWDVVGDMGVLTVNRTAGGTAAAPITVHATHSIAGLVLGAASHADFWAGMTVVPAQTRHAAVGTTFDDPQAAIKSITVRGWAVPTGTTPPAFFEDSNYSAAKLPIASILNVLLDNGQMPFGFWATSITSVKGTDNRVKPSSTWAWPKQQSPGPDLTIQLV